MNLEKQNVNLSAPEPEKKKHKIVIASVDIEQQARDIAEEKLLSSKKELKGVSGFWNKIWKHNLAHEYYRQKEIAKAKREIQQSGNLYVGEKGEKADHDNAMNAIVERFVSEYEGEDLLRRGEEKRILKEEQLGEKGLSENIQNLIKQFASGTITEEQFNLEKNNIFGNNLTDSKEKSPARKSLIYADNLLEIAKQIKDSIAHGKGLDALDEDFEIVLGKARVGVETEAQYNAVDRLTEKVQKSFVGRFVNETSVAMAVSIAYGMIVKGTVSVAHRGAKLAGPLGMGISAIVGGSVAGMREHKRINEERAQHSREMAKGKKIESGSKRREEMEKFRYETKNSTELTGNLKEALEGLKKQPSDRQLSLVLEHLNEINSRITFSDQEKVDLISFSDSKNVERERTAMYIMAAEAKVYLRKNIHADWATPYNNEQGLDEYLQHVKEAKIQKDFLGEKTVKDKAFSKMKNKKVAWAVTKGLGIGLVVGAAAQEIGTSFNNREGVFSGAGANEKNHHYTALGYLRRLIAGELPSGEMSSRQEIVEIKDFIKDHEELFSKIKRGVWADNDTSKFDKNELKLRWGGEKGAGIDKNGNYIFNIRQMTQGGSFHNGKNWNPQELMKEGKMKLLVSLSENTQNQVVEIPIDANGNAIIDPNSEIGKIAFENSNGHAKFIGKFAEVGVMENKVDGVDNFDILATHTGDGIKGVETTEFTEPVGYNVEAPFVVPVFSRRPMEKLGKEMGSGPMVSSGEQSITQKPIRSEAEKLENIRLFHGLLKSMEESILKNKNNNPARIAALHTIYRLNKYEDLNAATIEDGDKKFLELTRKLWTELTVHEKPDRDANACLKLMELAEIKIDKVKFVGKGDISDSGVIMDTSKAQHGVISEEDGKRLIIDHHGKESGRDTSAAKFVYETLVELGLLKKEKYLDEYVNFVTKCDNMNFSSDEVKQVHKNYSKNLYGLSFKMKTEDIFELFKNGVDPMADLPDDYLKSHKYFNPQNGGKYESLSKLAEYMENQIKNGKKALEKMEKAGFVVDTGGDRFGKILIDTKKKSSNGKYYNRIDGDNGSNQLEVFSKGYGGYLVWSPMENSFVLYTQRKIDEVSIPGGFSQGFNVRGNMWMKPQQDLEKLTMTLEEVLSKLKGNDFKIEGDLKKTLGVDLKGKEMLELLDEGNLTEDILKKSAIEANVPISKLLAEVMKPLIAVNKKYQTETKKISLDKNRTANANAVAIKLLLEYQEKKNGNGKHEKQRNISDSVKKMSDLFSNFGLSYDAIKEEAKRIQATPTELAVGFVQSDDKLRAQYETQLDAIPVAERDEKSTAELAMVVILESEEAVLKERIKEKDQAVTQKELEIKNETDPQKKQILEKEKMDIGSEKNKLKNKLADIGEQLIFPETF
ncbi:MAG TPA: hypothetical protein DEA27_01070 [Candidatus Moranbacteria bacterium]|nr:hypothetical protein [Candidatus Moranbacteria bacterium]